MDHHEDNEITCEELSPRHHHRASMADKDDDQ